MNRNLSKRRSGPWTEEQRRQRVKDKHVRLRFKQLGYEPKGYSYPCLCGEKPDDFCVWWLGGNKSKSDHLYCLSCGKRFYELEIAKALKNRADKKLVPKFTQSIRKDMDVTERTGTD